MTIITALDKEVEIVDGYWRVYQKTDRLKPPLLFETYRGIGILSYKANFGQAVGLPGTKISAKVVRAVVIGYQQKNLNWQLGLHIARNPEEKPRWIPLVAWPSSDNEKYANDVQYAARILAEYLGCPLKIFGIKRLETTRITGPLEEHKRIEIEREEVKRLAALVQLPMEQDGIWIGPNRNEGITMRISKQAGNSSSGEEEPGFQICDIDPKRASVKLIPPTGLLTAFFGGARGREIPFKTIRNVELRYVIENVASAHKDQDGMLIDITNTHHTWSVYLTLRDENVLLAKLGHVTSSELIRQRALTALDPRMTGEFHANVQRYRELERDQRRRERSRQWAATIAYVVAASMSKHIVSTQVGQELS